MKQRDALSTSTDAMDAEAAMPALGHTAKFVVAVGASAGGLEALERFFSHCPTASGAAFVVVQHLSPDHKSMMSDLLGRHTRMPVRVVEDGLTIGPDQVYLIPPGSLMRIADERFRLTPKPPHALALPIDIFLASLADAYGSSSVAVILSGTGSDGTRGAAAINAAGGFLLAQDPTDAKFDGMPTSVISTGLIDAILPADQLPEQVLAYLHGKPLLSERGQSPTRRIPRGHDEAHEAVLQLMLEIGGIDFHDYKPATVIRRIERRMQVHRIGSLADYLTFLEQDSDELSALRRELLIPVTRFFRDDEAFQTLARHAIHALIRQADINGSLRAWVAGTSTGEEAYSIAMLFLETFEQARRWPNLKIFATDVNQAGIDFAALGQYPDSAAAELGSERLERFFTRRGSGYQVKPELRQCIIFARHNLLTDPPFTRMNLVSCRNTLIYFTAQAQKRAMGQLQYAIQPGGFLFLGTSESLGSSAHGFSTLDSKHKLFQRPTDSMPVAIDTARPLAARRRFSAPGSAALRVTPRPTHDGIAIDEATSLLLTEYAPPSILVNDHHEAIHFFGRVQPFINHRPGSATLHLKRILPERLVPVASALLYKAVKENRTMMSDTLSPSSDHAGMSQPVRLSVTPLRQRGDERLLLLSFEQPQARNHDAPTPVDIESETAARMEMLEHELAASRDSLQATIEALETSNEELQATNEELMAANEELQSSNEELLSVNEELNTVNAEFQEKVSILNRANADLDNMSKAVGVATVFLDREFNITRFSPDACKVFRLRAGDVGRPLDEIVHSLQYPRLMDDIRMTLHTGRMIEHEAATNDGTLFLVRILPYDILSSPKQGVVASFIDITALRDRERLQAIIDALPDHLAVLDPDGTIVMINRAWEKFALDNGNSHLQHAGLGSNYLSACQAAIDADDSSALRAEQGIKAVLDGTIPTFSMHYPCHSLTEKRWFVMNVAATNHPGFGAVVSHGNITAWYTDHGTPECRDE